jgi:hypothetical protein
MTAVIGVAVIVGLIFVIQHVGLQDSQSHILENQVLLKNVLDKLENNTNKALENQKLLTEIGEDARAHEQREEAILGNNTQMNINISLSNYERLDKLLNYFNITS